jgi:hypothetical protein
MANEINDLAIDSIDHRSHKVSKQKRRITHTMTSRASDITAARHFIFQLGYELPPSGVRARLIGQSLTSVGAIHPTLVKACGRYSEAFRE